MPLPLGGHADRIRRHVQKMENKIVGMLRLNSIFRQRLGRKVPEIEGDDHIGLAVDCCRQDVAVIWIGKRQSWNQPFVAAHDAVANVSIHQVADSLDLPLRHVRMDFQDSPHPFLVNRL